MTARAKSPTRVALAQRLGQVAAVLFDWSERIAPGPRPGLCWAWGGTMPDGRVRLCFKRRWHYDSHLYDLVDSLNPIDVGQ
jgi:hypothetical protein